MSNTHRLQPDPPHMIQPEGCNYTPDEVGRMLANRVVQPHYAAWLVRKAIATAQRCTADTIASQAAELEGVRWRPIETAPKDGIIDVWSGGERVANAAWCAPDYGQDKSEGWCVSDWHTTYEHTYWDRIDPQPTHWMPLPKPPAIADSGAGGGA